MEMEMGMEMDASTHFTTYSWFAIVILLFLPIAWLFSKHHSKLSFPGPWRLPIIGHFHLLDPLLHRSLQKLSTVYGPIMHIRLGLVPAIVVSGPEAVELFLKTHDVEIASKPYMQVFKYGSYGGAGIVSSEYGQYWRNIRKLVTVHLLSAAKIDSFRSTREEKIGQLVKLLKGVAQRGEVFDISSSVGIAIEDITYRMIFGRRIIDGRFRPYIEEMMRLAAAPNLADYIPFIGAFDPQGYTQLMKNNSKLVDEFLEKIITEHEHQTVEQQEHLGGFLNVLMSLMKSNDAAEKLDRNQVKANIIELLAAAMDTAPSTTEWTFSELLRHPQVMKKLQGEVEQVVGLGRLVEERDLAKLEYLDAVVKESMRLHPVAATFVRKSTSKFTVNGVVVPSNTMIIVNNWAIGRDPIAWPEKTEKFYPERFIDSKIDVRGNDMQLIPFGSGRRKCPGMEMGLRTVKLVVAQLVHCFNWELPNGMSPEDLDMEEVYGLTVPRANHLLAVPSYRLSTDDV